MSDHHPSNHLSPERAVRLLRAKAGELESYVQQDADLSGGIMPVSDTALAADIALIATLLADHIELRSGLAHDTVHKSTWGPDSPGYDEMGQ